MSNTYSLPEFRGVPFGEKCIDCGSDILAHRDTGGCPICGAPNCCPKCCVEDWKEWVRSAGGGCGDAIDISDIVKTATIYQP